MRARPLFDFGFQVESKISLKSAAFLARIRVRFAGRDGVPPSAKI
jgi:hypothetical protein